MLTFAQKQEAVAELKDRFSRAKSVFVADYRGLDVQQVNQLRSKLRVEGDGDYEYHVVKNSLLRRAAEGSDVAEIADHFVGPTAIALSYGDPVSLAKTLVDYDYTGLHLTLDFQTHETSVTGPLLVYGEDRVKLAAMFAARIRAGYRVFGPLRLFAEIGLEVSLKRIRWSASLAGRKAVLFDPWPVHPRALAGLSVEVW